MHYSKESPSCSIFKEITANFRVSEILGFLLYSQLVWFSCFRRILSFSQSSNHLSLVTRRPGPVARLEASSLGMQAAPSSIPTSGTFFRGELVMKTFLRPFSLFRWFKKSSCQLLAKECALSTGKLPRNSVARLTDRARNDLNLLKGRKTEIEPNQIVTRKPVYGVCDQVRFKPAWNFGYRNLTYRAVPL